MLDARLWRDCTVDCEIWVGHRHGDWKYVMRDRSGSPALCDQGRTGSPTKMR
ncbi:hypothetical protein TIFTF001_039666 [Ficus carica]|uniref:Uncharacterized protein n=1 Tax=Ficus carica TaxID=3494 RepID=A0AA88JBB0_FICCA|nr:hypothetical protein TIFTF001_039666 [Ficus carica]